MTGGLRIEKLRREHSVGTFDCGKPALDRFLAKYVLQSQQEGASTTYVALDGDRIIGFHSLAYGLLKDAMLRALQAADIAGLRAILVHAKDDDARAFYEHFHFVASPTDPYHLMLLIKDVRAAAD